MSDERASTAPDLGGLLGRAPRSVAERLGAPAVDRAVGEDRWIVYEREGWSLRLRARSAGSGREATVRTWTVEFRSPFPSFDTACAAVGIEPLGAGPDEPAADVRRVLPDPETGALHSLTAVGEPGRIASLTAFDEPPDWDEAPGAPTAEPRA